MQDQVQGDAHKEGFMELSKIATRHISRSIFADQVHAGPEPEACTSNRMVLRRSNSC